MQRARRSSSHGSRDYSVDDDVEMEAMAKVWAHPEDLHLFPVSAKCSIYHCKQVLVTSISQVAVCACQIALGVWLQQLAAKCFSSAVVCAHAGSLASSFQFCISLTP